MQVFIVRAATFLVLMLLIAGCEDTTGLQRDNQRLQSQLSAEQSRTGELTREVARLGAEIRDLRPEIEELRRDRAASERMRIDAMNREEQAAGWIEQRDEHHALLNQWMQRHSECSAERDELKSRISRLLEDISVWRRNQESLEVRLEEAGDTANEWRQRHSECSSKVGEQSTSLEKKRESILLLEAARDELITELHEAHEANDAMRIFVAAAEEQMNEMDRLSAQLRILAEEQPTFFISLLAQPDTLSESDLKSWEAISLELESPRYRPGYPLTVTLPLSMLDPRGDVKLRFGSLEIIADKWDVEAKDRIVTFSFPSGGRLWSAMEVSATDILTVEFGPRDARGVLRFRIKDSVGRLTRTEVEFQLLSVEFAGLPVAFREPDGAWTLEAP